MKLSSTTRSKLTFLTIALLICLGSAKRTHASHAMGADFTYKCLGSNQYELKLTFYRDCAGISAPTSVPVDLNSVTCALNFSYTLPMVGFQEISSTCPSAPSTCQGGTEPGVEEYIYIDTVTIPSPCTDWVFSFTHCCRNATIDNLVSPSSANLYISSGLNNTGGTCNSSPVFSSLGVPYLCDTILTGFNFGAFDADGDSLVFSLINPLTTGGVPITHQVPYSATYPIITSTGSVTFDSTNGQLSFTPAGQQVCVITVLVQEYRAGTLIGSVMRDIQVLITNCAGNVPPAMSSGGIVNVVNGTLLDTAFVELCVGDALSFDLVFDDANAGDTVSVQTNLVDAFPAATFTTTGTNPVTGTFSWTPGATDAGLNNLTVAINDGNCPILGSQNYAFVINVLSGTYAGPDVYLCLGDTVQMQGEGGTSFQWTPSTGLANDTLANTLATPVTTTTYYLTSNFSGSCDTVDSMTIFVVPDFTPVFGNDQTICQGGAVQLSAGGIPSAAYSYQWSPGAGLDSTQIATPTASPITTTNYAVTITSPALCAKSGNVLVTVDSTVLNVTPSVSNKFLCPGDSAILDANIVASDTSYAVTWLDQYSSNVGSTEVVSVYPFSDMTYTVTITNGVCSDSKSVDVVMSMLEIGVDSIALCANDTFQTGPVFGPIGSAQPTVCGVSTGCSGTGGVSAFTMGTGTQVNANTSYPAPFGNWYKNAKHQILYTAADLVAAGLTAGTITEIGFFVTTIQGTTLYKSYELKLGCSAVSSLSTWESGLVQVFAPTNVTITTGLNNLVLTTPYDWDGVSNLILEICFDNLADPSYTYNSESPYTTTSYTSALYYNSDATPACPYVATQTTSFNRPNTSFTICSEAFTPVFSWTPAAGVSNDTIVNPAISPSVSALYKLTMDNGLCVVTDSVYIAYSSSLGLSGTAADAACGISNGSATVSAGGGNAPYTYLWDDPAAQTTATATGLGLGSYNVIVTDANGCTDNLAISVSEAGGPVLTTSQFDISCYGGSDGEASVNATGGTPPYTYLWDDPAAQTSATAVGLTAGTYSVNVTGTGCASSTVLTLTEPGQMAVSGSVTAPLCNGDCNGTASVTVSGGTAPFTYLWDDPSAQTGDMAIGLCDGTFKAVFTDANGCSDSTGMTVTGPVAIVPSVSGLLQNPCYGDCLGSATIGVGSGGVPPFAYSWDDPAAQTGATASLLCAGSYVGTVVDSNGCSADTAVMISEPAGTVTLMSAVDASCGASDGSAIVNASGGVPPYTYSWNDPGSQTTDTAGGVSFGVYTVVITDANGCSTVDSVSVNNIGAPTLTAVVDNDASCFGFSDGSATATAAGGTPPVSYQWNDPSAQTGATAGGLAAGSYTVTVADSNACAASAFVIITEPPVLTTAISVTEVTCNAACDATGQVSVTGGTAPYAYLWSDLAAQTNAGATNLCMGLITCTVTDTNGCVALVSDTIIEPAKLLTSTMSQDETCSDGNGQVSVGAVGGTLPYTYLWNDPSAQTNPIATGLAAGTYTVVITDSNGCTATDSAALVNIDVTLDSLTAVNPNCGACDGMITAVASGGAAPYTYLWSDSLSQTTATAGNLCQGSYTLMMTDGNGCTKTDSATITEPSGFTLSSTTQNLLCGGLCDGSATVTVNGGVAPYTYLWDDPGAQTGATATGLCLGSYSVNVTDGAGCTVTEIVTITGPNPFSVNISNVVDASTGASDGSATATAMGGVNPVSYLWSDPAGQTTATASGLPAGSYTVTVTDGNGCTDTATAVVSEGTGIWDQAMGARFDVYPNPTSGTVTFDLEMLDAGSITIEVLDMLGEAVYTTTHVAVSAIKLEADLSQLSDGIYLVRLRTCKGTMKRRIAVTK